MFMRMRRRVTESFWAMVIPAICCAVTFYFGYSGIFGERGLLAWNDTRTELAVAKRDLDKVHGERAALQHRISLLDDRAIDPDLLEEVARGLLLENRSNEVAVPREKR
jgi:cell division protein FtsB